MKQQITKKQWDELDEEKKIKMGFEMKLLDNKLPDNFITTNIGILHYIDCFYSYPNIGQMIEFLGDDWINRIGGMKIISQKTNNEFCDLLWEAVKYKLNNPNEKS